MMNEKKLQIFFFIKKAKNKVLIKQF